jgi:hypothetical protein
LTKRAKKDFEERFDKMKTKKKISKKQMQEQENTAKFQYLSDLFVASKLQPTEREISVQQAEAIGAIGSDFAKGSGNIELVNETLKELQDLHDEGETISFDHFFTGKKPLYAPSVKGGRKLATQRTTERYKRRRLTLKKPIAKKKSIRRKKR